MTTEPDFSFTCSPCGESIISCTSLKRHWLSDKHTRIARDKWGSESSHDKWYCLVVFSNSKLCSVDVTKYFSGSELPEGTENEGAAPLPKNVVWWVDRPQAVFLEYESRDSAEKAFFSQNADFMKCHKDMLLKRAYELHDFEWLSLFPVKIANKMKPKTGGELISQDGASRKRPLQDDDPNQPKQLKIVDCSNSILQLNKYCQERGWELPKLCSSVVGKKRSKKFVCVAYVNGVERANSTYHSRECKNSKESVRKTAQLCLKNLEEGVHVEGQVEGNFEPVKTDGPPLETAFGEWDIPEEDREVVGRVEENWAEDESWENNFEIKNETVKETKVNEKEMETGIKSVVKKEDTSQEEEKLNEDEKMEELPSSTVSSPPPPKEDPDWEIKLLEEMANLRGWDHPFYRVYRCGRKELLSNRLACNLCRIPFNIWGCRIAINKLEYQPFFPDDLQTDKWQAKRKAASECLKMLLESEPEFDKEKTVTEIMKHSILPTIRQLKTLTESKLANSLSSDPPPPPFANECGKLIIESLSNPKSPNCFHAFTALQNFLQIKEPALFADILTSWKWNPISDKINPLIYMINSDSTIVTVDMIKTAFQNGGTSPEEDAPFVLEEDEDNQKLKVKHVPSNVTLSLVPGSDHLLEIQQHRLLEYLCTFDVRVLPLLTVAEYWAAINSVEIGGPQGFGEASTLEWLIIFFLCHKQILPTPKEIQRRPHPPLIDPVTSADIGFNADPVFAKVWGTPEGGKKKRGVDPVEIFQLFNSFLHFCGIRFGMNPVIVNVRDCELIDKGKFCDSVWNRRRKAGFVALSTELTLKEIQEFRDMDLEGREADLPKERFRQCQMFVTSPFIATRELAISKNMKRSFKVINITGNRLSKLLKDYSMNPMGTRSPTNEEISLLAMNLKEMLKIDSASVDGDEQNNEDIMDTE